jgi:hypothetical protein
VLHDLGLYVGALVVLILHWIGFRPRWLLLSLTILLVVVSGSIFPVLGFEREPRPVATVGGVLLIYSAALYVTLSEVMLMGFAKFLTSWRGEKWTKEIDYVYLTLGLLGILGSLSRIEFLTERFENVDIIAPLVICTAIVVRFIKTRAEIDKWNK